MERSMDRFAEIRPYNDNEVIPVLENLLADNEFIDTIASLWFGRLNRYIPWVFRIILYRRLKKELSAITDVQDFQTLVKRYMDRMIKETTKGFAVSNLDNLEKGKPYLFISNHRDIALDPAFVNYTLIRSDRDTARIAIGDNLLSKPFASDLMRLNKCFIVKRFAKGPRMVLEVYKTLSAYIRQSIEEEKIPVWIAQKEGRAKNGNDYTDPAIIKMLMMSRDKKRESFTDYIKKLCIMPVSISYEYDPLDGVKAKELFQKAQYGGYKKDEYEDLDSMGLGIVGQKGSVHLCFGNPLDNEFDTPEAVASAVDRQIIKNYVLHPTNFFAYQRLHGNLPDLSWAKEGNGLDSELFDWQRRYFEKRINKIPTEHRKYALGIYANPVVNKIKLEI
jgi:hypothetical protein